MEILYEAPWNKLSKTTLVVFESTVVEFSIEESVLCVLEIVTVIVEIQTEGTLISQFTIIFLPSEILELTLGVGGTAPSKVINSN